MPRLSAYGRRVAELVLPHAPLVRDDCSGIDFIDGALSCSDFPTLVWRCACDRALVQKRKRSFYRAPEGETDLRAELQGYLRRARGLSRMDRPRTRLSGLVQPVRRLGDRLPGRWRPAS
jgi:GntR family transcriptional regulator / MocR family aminotransferase